MREYENVFSKIQEYFQSLGYNETMFESETSLNSSLSNTIKVDFVVKKLNSPFIIVEAKLGKSFGNITNEDFKYDPSVRQVQTYAMHSGADFYVVTNGSEFLWFKTGEDGRPQKIEPVFFHSGNSDNMLGATIGEVLNLCREFLKSDAMVSDFMYELTLILLARFAVENHVPPNKISYEINEILETHYSFDISLISRVSPKTLEHCWIMLSECRPETADRKQLINSLKLLAQKNKNYQSFRVSEKLSEFLINLAHVEANHVVLDPTANWGEISSAVMLTNNQNSLHSYCQSPEQYAFLVLLNKIMNNDIHNIRLISIQDFVLNSVEGINCTKYDTIISAFPFGNRHTNLEELRYRVPIDLNNSEDYMLIAALEALNRNGRLVAIIPESMLFAGGKRERLRQYIVERYCLRSVISLPAGAISNSNVKTSIIVIDKTKTSNGSVFFGVVNNTDFNENSLFADENHNSFGLLKAYETYLRNGFIQSSDYWKSFLVGSDVENLRAETFLSIDETISESQYPMHPIKELCLFIKRGTAIKNDDNGTIPFLGPATVRINKVDDTKCSYTSEEYIKKSLLYVENGTVLLNNISTNLGAAAVLESEKPLPINQHIIALLPLSQKVLPQYLAIALNSKEVSNNILRASTGVTIPSITLENLKEIQIPVPELAIQHKIIDSVKKIQNDLIELEKRKMTLEKKLTDIINSLEPEGV